MATEPEDIQTLRKRIEAIEAGTFERDAKSHDGNPARRRALGRSSTLRRTPLQRKSPLRRTPKTK